jgi:uncharacterized protein YktA (UPF0223 family)
MLLFKAWYERKYDLREFEDLFQQLDYHELSKEYDTDNLIESYYEIIFGESYDWTSDDPIENYLEAMFEKIQANLLVYESDINTTDLISKYRQNKEITTISKAYLDVLEKSQYSSPDVMKILEECPETESGCYDSLDDETSTCSVFGYGVTAFHENDLQHSSRDLR